MFCKNCGNSLDDDAIFCSNCGSKLSEIQITKFCMNCGTALDEDSVFCSNCGCKVKNDNSPNTVDEVQPEQNFYTETKDEIPKPAIDEVPAEQDVDVKATENTKQDSAVEEKSDNNIPPETAANNDDQISEEPSNKKEEAESEKKKDEKQENNRIAITLILLALIVLFAALCGVITSDKGNTNKLSTTKVETTREASPWVTSDTFNLDVFKPFTFNYSDDWDKYEFDCYNLSDEFFSTLWNQPPKYFIYNGKKYEVDNTDLDYYEISALDFAYGSAANTLKKYNLFIEWSNFDGVYYHFDSVYIQNSSKGFALY